MFLFCLNYFFLFFFLHLLASRIFFLIFSSCILFLSLPFYICIILFFIPLSFSYIFDIHNAVVVSVVFIFLFFYMRPSIFLVSVCFLFYILAFNISPVLCPIINTPFECVNKYLILNTMLLRREGKRMREKKCSAVAPCVLLCPPSLLNPLTIPPCRLPSPSLCTWFLHVFCRW